MRQTVVEYPQVTAHYAPSAGYFPLPAWAALAVLAAYTLAVVRPALNHDVLAVASGTCELSVPRAPADRRRVAHLAQRPRGDSGSGLAA